MDTQGRIDKDISRDCFGVEGKDAKLSIFETHRIKPMTVGLSLSLVRDVLFTAQDYVGDEYWF